MNNIEEYYQILEVTQNSSLEEIKKAYHKQAKKWHPDKFVFVNDINQQSEAEEKFRQIKKAYEIIKAHLSGDINLNHFQQNNSNVSVKTAESEYHYNLGVNVAKEGNYEESLNHFRMAIKLNPEYIEALEYRKYIFQKLGFTNRANNDAQRIAQIKLNTIKKNKKSDKLWKFSLLLKQHKEVVSAIAINQTKNSYFVSGSYDKTVKVWDIQQGDLIHTFKGHSQKINDIAIDNNKHLIFSASDDHTIKIWDLKTQTLSKTLTHSSGVLIINLYEKNNQLLSIDSLKNIKLWDFNTGKEIYSVQIFSKCVAFAVSPHDNIFITAGIEKYLRIREINNGTTLYSIKTNSSNLSIAFHPLENIIAVGQDDHNITLYNITTREKISILKGHYSIVTSVVFTPDGKYLISGSFDNTMRIWSIKEAREISSLYPNGSRVSSLAISADGKTLISSNLDNNTIGIWRYQN